MTTFKFATIITAGGTSSRFGSNKLLEKLGDKSVIETVVEKFLPYSFEIIIPASEDIQDFLAGKYDKIRFAPAGRTRQESVFNALKVCSNPDYVLIHELVHTKIKNHSEKFWHEVEKYCPDYKELRKVGYNSSSKIALFVYYIMGANCPLFMRHIYRFILRMKKSSRL